MGRKRKRDYRIWSVFDTETCNVIEDGADPFAVPILYIFNDVHEVSMDSYFVDCPEEHVAFYRHEEEAIAHIDRIIHDALEQGVIPVMCVYNMIFDLQTILYRLHDSYDMRANAQSSTNVYTLDLMLGNKVVLRIWDTYHLEMRGLRAMGETCGLSKLVGDWDYDLIRTPDTPLTDEELGYAARDVQVIPAYLRYLCDANEWLEPWMLGNRVITKTSLVRQMARHDIGPLKVRTSKGRKLTLRDAFEHLCKEEQARDFDGYALRLSCFRGGLTFTAGCVASRVVEHVLSLDETSAHHFCINGRRVPVKFMTLEPEYLNMWLDDIQSYTLDDVLNRYAYPFQRWVHAEVRIDNLRLRAGSAFAAWDIAVLPQAKFTTHVIRRTDEDENVRHVMAEDDIRARGYGDTCVNPTFAFGKLVEADSATVHVTELEWWILGQVYEWDGYEGLRGEGSINSIWPPDYVTLQSNVLFERKSDAKMLDGTYVEGTPYVSSIPASIPDGIAQGLREGELSHSFLHAWYGSTVKGAFNSIYGTQAQNVLKPEYAVDDESELYVNGDTKVTPETYAERVGKIQHPTVLYTYGMRIVGGSRLQLVIAIMLLWQTFKGRVTVCGGDTDSIKVRCDDDVTPDDILDALEPLHNATTAAIDVCMCRMRRNFPQLCSTLEHVGCFEVEPATREEPFYALHMEAWNKARVSIDGDGRPHVTCAGLPRPAGAYHIETWLSDVMARGADLYELLPLVIGYNVTVTNDVCHSLEHKKPLFSDMVDMSITDYKGVTRHVHTHEAIALYPATRTMGDTLKNVNLANVERLRTHFGYEVDTTEKVLTCDYDYPLALAVANMPRVSLPVARAFVRDFRRPALYMQTEWGMERKI